MIGLDCNILVQLAFADHPGNARIVSFLEAETGRNSKLLIPALVISEFLHVATDPRRFMPPLSMTEALDWIDELLKNPLVEVLDSPKASIEKTFLWMRQFNLGRKRILDAHLAAVLVTAGVRRLATSNPADFRVFTELEIISP